MTVYTGIADENGDFTIPFSQDYKGGQKVIVTAEKSGASKSIELYAPSESQGGSAGLLTISGNTSNFPNNIGIITLSGINGAIASNAFYQTNADLFFAKATGLVIGDGVTEIKGQAFYGWSSAKSLVLPSTLTKIENHAFYMWNNLESLKIPEGVTSIGRGAFLAASGVSKLKTIELPTTLLTVDEEGLRNAVICEQLVCHAISPPSLLSYTSLLGLASTCVIKVPAGSVSAYKSAWSAYASQIQAI
ncbi:leucine-rich repeat domain-containing protein [Acinetobacter cumulans]|uniref:Leucine-rich repeat domain-containing protein n=1 Tax=Acinetobacter cumulans TaxID=2136182 RepID=A0A3A8GD77_9GAMM|nr:leucine-rich repeat domain-containing protein [Acinetobacter cumulans]RKG52964.1 leucine-rich repeat domain-containing protein [Acinetobacter cumulans]